MKILIVLPRFPYPLEKGDKLRAFHQIRVLSENNEIYLFCISHTKVLPEHVAAVSPYCKSIKVVRSPKLVNYKNVLRNYIYAKSLQIGYWDSRKARKAYKSFEAEAKPDVIYNQMVRTMTMVSRSPIPKVMDFQDALSMNTERRMEQSHGLWHYLLHFEFKMLRSTEYNSFKIFDALTIISEPDSEAIPHKKNGEIHIVPNGVDFNYFHPLTLSEDSPRYDIVFCGNMQYDPNVKASRFLVEEVMPLVWREMPSVTVLLAGATPKNAVRHLASSLVTVSGWVDDIRQAYASAKIFVAPMQTGSGLQNKLLEAMAMKLPCVTSSIANASLHATDNSNILIGDTAEEVAHHILTLLADKGQRQSISDGGYDFVHSHFSWEAAGHQLEKILYDACHNHV